MPRIQIQRVSFIHPPTRKTKGNKEPKRRKKTNLSVFGAVKVHKAIATLDRDVEHMTILQSH